MYLLVEKCEKLKFNPEQLSFNMMEFLTEYIPKYFSFKVLLETIQIGH
jgi:hypothetical protein